MAEFYAEIYIFGILEFDKLQHAKLWNSFSQAKAKYLQFLHPVFRPENDAV